MVGVLPPLPQGSSLKDTYPSVKDGFAAAAKRNGFPESKVPFVVSTCRDALVELLITAGTCPA